jgi:hypothetical protein
MDQEIINLALTAWTIVSVISLIIFKILMVKKIIPQNVFNQKKHLVNLNLFFIACMPGTVLLAIYAFFKRN